ncbi:MAG: 6-phosphogluconolactonase [Chloroflexota bacterium]
MTSPAPTAAAMTPVRVFPDDAALGSALAAEVMAGVRAARRDGRRYLLGCPGGRSARTTYQALAELARGEDMGTLVIVMMDEYLEPAPGGGFRHVSPDAPHSCRRFAEQEIRGPIDAVAATPVPADHVWLPDPADVDAYEPRIEAAGGVDLFIVASGASDGHVAFMPPGSSLDGGVAIVPLAETTRRDNMATFPTFRSLDEVPIHGVSVGLGTIARQSRTVRLIMLGEDKRASAARVAAASGFDPAWPATVIHACRDAAIWLDSAARGGREEEPSGGPRGARTEEVT